MVLAGAKSFALIAGTGGLPPVVTASLVAQGHAPLICEMHGFSCDVVGDYDRVSFRIETLAAFLATLTARGVTHICMAGAVQRPAVDPSLIDAATLPMVPRLMAAMAKGDDGTLREVISIFEEHGFVVIGAHDIAPDLLPDAGTHTKITPPDLSADVIVARGTLDEMGHADQGQAMLILNGTPIAREDARGTEALISSHHDMTGAVLFKAPKPNQVLQADMPVIGPDTAQQAAKSGLAGIVIPLGGVMVLDLAQVCEILDQHDMFLWVAPEGQL